MQSVDTSAVINNTRPQNILATSVAFAFASGSGDTLTVTDNTDYPDGDSLQTGTVLVADRFGHKKEYNFGVDDGNTSAITINLTDDGFNSVDGIDALVTIASHLRHYKDGSVFDIGIGKPAGNFVMEI